MNISKQSCLCRVLLPTFTKSGVRCRSVFMRKVLHTFKLCTLQRLEKNHDLFGDYETYILITTCLASNCYGFHCSEQQIDWHALTQRSTFLVKVLFNILVLFTFVSYLFIRARALELDM